MTEVEWNLFRKCFLDCTDDLYSTSPCMFAAVSRCLHRIQARDGMKRLPASTVEVTPREDPNPLPGQCLHSFLIRDDEVHHYDGCVNPISACITNVDFHKIQLLCLHQMQADSEF